MPFWPLGWTWRTWPLNTHCHYLVFTATTVSLNLWVFSGPLGELCLQTLRQILWKCLKVPAISPTMSLKPSRKPVGWVARWVSSEKYYYRIYWKDSQDAVWSLLPLHTHSWTLELILLFTPTWYISNKLHERIAIFIQADVGSGWEACLDTKFKNSFFTSLFFPLYLASRIMDVCRKRT